MLLHDKLKSFNIILASASPRRRELLKATGTTLTKIGAITEGNSLTWLEEGKPRELDLNGFTHF